jgi:hypothetical protein
MNPNPKFIKHIISIIRWSGAAKQLRGSQYKYKPSACSVNNPVSILLPATLANGLFQTFSSIGLIDWLNVVD